ncbi:transporter substrate-binding domain-containing protein [Saccharospirillum salsuginis]|uniref:ABC transporter substrate-binding protein n=1 Tax=Saccharospirillum salsuginis TaxID=418750 RepID=A0A918KED2_9GAMM|nr:transporter substrate-binding domain-containing protein [Saccharospirillum salsuginis]GGX58295.1 ABC transporter substrate-binding protein [Saccharospirillum salsuginis]
MLNRLIFILLLAGSLPAAELKPLIVASEVWPPYVTDRSDLPGFDVEVSRRVLADLGYDLQLRLMPWRRALVHAKSREVDAVLDAFDGPDRHAWLYYPDEPLSTSTSSLFCHDCDRTSAPGLEELTNAIVAVNRGYQYSDAFDAHPGIDRVEVGSFRQGFMLLARGRVDYYAINNRVGLFTLQQMDEASDFRLLTPPIAPVEPVYLVFAHKPGLEALSRRFSERLAEFKQTEDYRAILARYGIVEDGGANPALGLAPVE